MARQNGFYWVKYNNSWIIAEYCQEKWFVTGNSIRCPESTITEIDETPITRPVPISKLLPVAQTLGTLQEVLADFPDSLLIARCKIEMHNKFSIQITEYNIENVNM